MKAESAREVAEQGFNPCCRGLGSKTRICGRFSLHVFHVSILVVVDWVQRRVRLW